MDSSKKDYIIQEAEAIIAECEKSIDSIEKSKSKIIMRKDKSTERKYKKLKIISSIFFTIETILLISSIISK